VAEEERPVEVEGDEALPLGERELVDCGGRPRDDRAPAHRVDQDVDPPELAHDAVDHVTDLGRVQGVARSRVPLAPGPPDPATGLLESALVGVDADADAALAPDDLGGGAADPARRRRA